MSEELEKKRKVLRDLLEREGYRRMDDVARLHNITVKQAYAWLGEVRERAMAELEKGSISMSELRRTIPKKLLDLWTEDTKVNNKAAPPPPPASGAGVEVTLDGEYVNIRVPSQMLFEIFTRKQPPSRR